MINTNHPVSLTRPNAADVFRWLEYISWLGGAIFIGALLFTITDCQRSEHIASTWGGIPVLSMIATYAVRVRCAQLVPTLVRRRTRPARMSLAPSAAHLHAARVGCGNVGQKWPLKS
jgi:hypothetical protein